MGEDGPNSHHLQTIKAFAKYPRLVRECIKFHHQNLISEEGADSDSDSDSDSEILITSCINFMVRRDSYTTKAFAKYPLFVRGYIKDLVDDEKIMDSDHTYMQFQWI